MSFLVGFINILVQLVTLLVIIHVFLSYFMPPYHPVRVTINNIVEPLLRPIRNILPPTGMLDLSPIVLIILIQIMGRILISVLLAIG